MPEFGIPQVSILARPGRESPIKAHDTTVSGFKASMGVGCKLCQIIWQGTTIFYPDGFDKFGEDVQIQIHPELGLTIRFRTARGAKFWLELFTSEGK